MATTIHRESIKHDLISQDVDAIVENIEAYEFQILSIIDKQWISDKIQSRIEEQENISKDDMKEYMALANEYIRVIDDINHDVILSVYDRIAASYGNRSLFDELSFEVFSIYYSEHEERKYYILQAIANLIQQENGIRLEVKLPDDVKKDAHNKQRIMRWADKFQRDISSMSNESLIALYEKHNPDRLDDERQALVDEFITEVEGFQKQPLSVDEQKMARSMLEDESLRNIRIENAQVDWATSNDNILEESDADTTMSDVEQLVIQSYTNDPHVLFTIDWMHDEVEFAYELSEAML